MSVVESLLSRGRYRIFCLVLLLVLALNEVACTGFSTVHKYGNKAIATVLDSAELIMNDNPDLAYGLLESMDYRNIRLRKHQAYYALLYTEALYKNYLPIESDSLIMTAVLYYTKHNNLNLLFRAYYYLGCVYSELNCIPDAVVALSQAEKYVDYVSSNFSKGLLYSKMGAVFVDSFDYNRAETYFRKAIDYFDKAGKNLYKICSISEIGNIKMEQNQYNEAAVYFDQVLELARSTGEDEYMSAFIMNKLTNYVLAADTIGARLSVLEYLSLFGDQECDSRTLGTFARYYILIHDLTSARTCLDKAWQTPVEPDSINLYFDEYLYQKQLGNMSEALHMYDQSMYLQNQNIYRILERPVVGAQRDYYRTVSELESVKARNRVIILMASTIIFILIILSYTLFYKNRERKAAARIRDYLFTIDGLISRETLSQETIKGLNAILREKTDSERTDKETIHSLNKRIFELSAWQSINKDKISILNMKVREMLRQRFLPSDFLYTRYYEQLDDKKKAERLYKVVKSQIDDFTSSRNIDRMDSLLNETYSGIMKKLSSAQLALQEKELMLIRFILAGFSAKSIAAILNDTHQNINQRKKRLLDKIARKSEGVMEELGIILSIK